eukprot:scaffold3003_cov267-Chaetoceros_neogracile.AAC.4
MLLLRYLVVLLVPFQSYANVKNYERLTMDEIVDEMQTLASLHPDLVSYSTTQAEYGLPKTCEGHSGCWNHFLTITDSKIYSHKSARKAKKERPDVFLSGALHGNERVGPVATIQVAKLLATAASCESGNAPVEVDCNAFYRKYTKREVVWLARLVSTRRIVIVPAANSNGYYNNQREEGGFDPNRDFAFDQQISSNDGISNTCMRTIAARTINELFLHHMFQMAVIYHGGIESITYEWGSTSIPRGKMAPDFYAGDVITNGLSQYAGKLYPNTLYKTGDTNSVVYPVRGGFESWAYAGSWTDNLVNKCSPQTYNGYDISKTTYDDTTLRSFSILVETSNSKNPDINALGTDEKLLTNLDYNANNGYISKHVRTALMAIDIVEPYIEIIQCKKKMFRSELKPLVPLRRRWSKREKIIRAKTNHRPRVTWTVGGSFRVDQTFLVYGLWKDFPKYFNGIQQLNEDQLEVVLDNSDFSTTSAKRGGTRWSSLATEFGVEETFSAKLDLSRFSAPNKVAIFAFAKVDQSWDEKTVNVWPNIGIQSHLANGRTNPNYRAKKISAGRIVQGRHHWISIPLTIEIKPDQLVDNSIF